MSSHTTEFVQYTSCASNESIAFSGLPFDSWPQLQLCILHQRLPVADGPRLRVSSHTTLHEDGEC